MTSDDLHHKHIIPFGIQVGVDPLCLVMGVIYMASGITDWVKEVEFNIRVSQAIRIHWYEVSSSDNCNAHLWC